LPSRMNVEIKARLSDRDALLRCLEPMAEKHTVLRQKDTFFRVAHGRLKLRRSTEADGHLPLQDMLDRSLGTLGTVCKERHLFLVGCTRVHVDAVQGLGDFLELEVVLREGQDPEEGRATAEALMAVLGVQPDSLESGSYLDLLALH
ncbi:adenylate cyclase, putative, partial [Ixodes scapularis]